MPRGIQQIHLFDNGIVLCYDAAFRQSPSLQGMFWDIKDKILEKFGEDSVQWVLVRDGKVVNVSRSEWVKTGEGINHQSLPEKCVTPLHLEL